MKKIKVYSDFICPFCYIGFTIANKLRREEEVEFIWKPYILDGDTPSEGRDLSETVDRKQSKIAYKRIEGLASEYGLIYNNKDKSFNSLKAHKAALYARDQGLYYEFAEKVFKSVFQEGKNIYDDRLVDKIGKSIGLDVDKMKEAVNSGDYDREILDSMEEAKKDQVESVPTFILENGKKVTELKDYKNFKKDLLDL